jgi:hypothetical protein
MIQHPVDKPDLAKRILDARGDLMAASAHLNRRANQVFRATAAVVADLIAERLTAFVLGQPDRTQSLGSTKVDNLKRELAAMVAEIPARSAKHLAGAFAWTFPRAPTEIGDRDRSPLFRGDQSLPWMIDDVIREMTAAGARLAQASGYEIGPASHWDIAPDGNVRRYLGPLEVPSRLTLALRSYSDARLRYFRALRIVRRLEAEKHALDARLAFEVEQDSAIAPARWLWTESRKASG